MGFIDWSIVVILLSVLVLFCLKSRRYSASVADFLVGGRCAGRYMICISEGIGTVGAISIIAVFEAYAKAGFPWVWWDMLIRAFVMLMFLSGWVVYRFRQTRAMTLAQFFEIRYSRKFRIFAGVVAWISGVINFGIFPSAGTRFLIYFCRLPQEFSFLGLTLSTYPVLMFALLLLAVIFTNAAGQITNLITHFIEGTFCNFAFVALAIYVLFTVKGDFISEVLSKAPPGHSMLNPFDSFQTADFNLFFYLILAFTSFYGCMAWQGTQAFNASALNAQEAKMGKLLGEWRLIPQNLFLLILPIGAYTVFHHSAFADEARYAQEGLTAVASPQIQEQMFTAISLSSVMSKMAGIMGLFCAIIIATELSCNTSYMHSWGAIFIQDVVMPFRKSRFDKKTHMLLLRLSIIFVAIFIYFFSLLFKQTDYILMFMQITGAIYLGGAGAAIIGGLYWKRGTTAGAWVAMVFGAVGSVAGIIIQQLHNSSPFNNPVLAFIGSQNGAVLGFYVAILAIVLYVVCSLITYNSKNSVDLDKILHRGKYKVAELEDDADSTHKGSWITKMFGFEKNMKFSDKFVSCATSTWSLLLVSVFCLITFWNFLFPIETVFWIKFWHVYVYVMASLSIAIAVWLLIGGLSDYRKMIHYLKTKTTDEKDDGFVDQADASITSQVDPEPVDITLKGN